MKSVQQPPHAWQRAIQQQELRVHHDLWHQQRREQQHNWSLDRFCKSRGFTREKLDKHKNFDDVMVLLSFDGWEHAMTEKDQEIWTTAWKWVYTKEFALSEYHLRRLRSIVDGIEFKQRRREQQQAQRRGKRSGCHT
ncbi:hypothetical protein UFOVP109_24 [uncultured Caudovirales phage]|uniref:Uncharacterized protein n=1 Tax=uncultured Caudovirales phage TaxID=2100421 RepID=A0A6J5L3G5_9CAUD|nr:hypothetical protein UFOVP109_24 [uncultured Caudovirales phage]CAB5218866.1 hypothetical protein UFOVP224_4 [uncultured Caudovirales phage]